MGGVPQSRLPGLRARIERSPAGQRLEDPSSRTIHLDRHRVPITLVHNSGRSVATNACAGSVGQLLSDT